VTRTLHALRIGARIAGGIVLLLGILFWSGNAYALLPLHLLLGILLVLTLWTVAACSLRVNGFSPLAAVAIVWGVVVPVFGMTQSGLLVGSLHWIVRVLHLAVGIVMLALIERMARTIGAQAPGPRTAAPRAPSADP
jgi:hypothetical protein